MFDLLIYFLIEVFFYKLGCWSLWLFSFGKLKWDRNGTGNPFLMSALGLIVFVLFSFFLFKVIGIS